MATPKQAGRVSVQVVCVAEGRNFAKEMLVPVGQTVGWCVNASGVVAVYPAFMEAKIGVWGKRVARDVVVAEGDRIEVYAECYPEAVQRARKIKAGGRVDGVVKGTDLSDNGG